MSHYTDFRDKRIKLLALVGALEFQDQWNVVMFVQELIRQGQAKVGDYTIYDSTYAIRKDRMGEDKFWGDRGECWSAYSEHTYFKFFVRNGQLFTLARVDNGSMGGTFTGRRFKVEVEIPNDYIEKEFIARSLDYKFNEYLEKDYLLFLQEQKEAYIQSTRKVILDSLK